MTEHCFVAGTKQIRVKSKCKNNNMKKVFSLHSLRGLRFGLTMKKSIQSAQSAWSARSAVCSLQSAWSAFWGDREVTWSAFHSTKNSEIFETGTNGTNISREKFQKIRKLLNFRKANHSTENSGNSGVKTKWNGNFQENMFENLGIPHEVVPFSEIMQILDFQFSANSFGRDDSELDISRKDDGDAYSKIEIL